ncbi:MAG: 16S rRNA (cytidine(1402)-2'-O)-methyltransferase, partial [Acidimicrobiales bacterium]|nr:16S rRNA (cytidine(1402)-2'-O)-methyltransferase [Acidimicrobiales bacterium]
MATPIGNLSDLSPRAERALADADVIACEDTRRTRQLLSHAGIHDKTLIAVHDHNEARQVRPVLDWLSQGRTVAVVTDAGMPGISDPGSRLAAAAATAGAEVTVVP